MGSEQSKRAPRIIVDGWLLRQHSHGMASHACNLLEGLAASEWSQRIVVAIPKGDRNCVPKNLAVEVLPVPPAYPPMIEEAIWQERLGWHIQRHCPDDVLLALSPFLSIPWPRRSVVICYDLIHLHFKRYAGRFLYRRLLLWGRCRMMKKASVIVTDSRFVSAGLEDYIGPIAAPVVPIHLWAPASFKPLSPNDQVAFRTRMGLPRRYWLYVGGYDYRKNVELLISAYAKARRAGGCPTLVMAGRLPEDLRKPVCDVRGALQREGLEDSAVLFPGFINASDLPGLYASAELFIYPSLMEGFGLPPVEAMACGCPAIVADGTSLSEVVVDEEYRFSARDSARLAEMLVSAAHEPWRLNPGFDRDYFGQTRGLRDYLQVLERVMS